MSEKIAIQQEIASVSENFPLNLKGNIYNVPEDYFQKFYLSFLSQKNSIVPENYFNEFPDKIVKIVNKETTIRQRESRIVKMKPFYNKAVAAVITGLLGLTLFNMPFKNTHNNFLSSDTYKSANAILNNGNLDDIFNSIQSDAAAEYLVSHGQDVNSGIASISAENFDFENPDESLISISDIDNFLNDNSN